MVMNEYTGILVDNVPTNVLVWLVDTYGPMGQRWFVVNNTIYFKDPKDYFWFELRWTIVDETI
jgi:hypothetical protein